MKTIALVDIAKPDEMRAALCRVLPGQEDPWLLLSKPGDPIAYFNIGTDDEESGGPCIDADVSGRHYYEDDAVRRVLNDIAAIVGGRIREEQSAEPIDPANPRKASGR